MVDDADLRSDYGAIVGWPEFPQDGLYAALGLSPLTSNMLAIRRRFANFVKVADGELVPGLGPCHVWMGGTAGGGYGTIRLGSRKDGTRRKAKAAHLGFLFANGRLANECVLHRCDNPPCVRPDHLFDGSQLDNARDRDAKGRLGPRAGEKNGNAVLTLAQVQEIRDLYATGEFAYARLGVKYGVGEKQIGLIVRRVQWNV